MSICWYFSHSRYFPTLLITELKLLGGEILNVGSYEVGGLNWKDCPKLDYQTTTATLLPTPTKLISFPLTVSLFLSPTHTHSHTHTLSIHNTLSLTHTHTNFLASTTHATLTSKGISGVSRWNEPRRSQRKTKSWKSESLRRKKISIRIYFLIDFKPCSNEPRWWTLLSSFQAFLNSSWNSNCVRVSKEQFISFFKANLCSLSLFCPRQHS